MELAVCDGTGDPWQTKRLEKQRRGDAISSNVSPVFGLNTFRGAAGWYSLHREGSMPAQLAQHLQEQHHHLLSRNHRTTTVLRHLSSNSTEDRVSRTHLRIELGTTDQEANLWTPGPPVKAEHPLFFSTRPSQFGILRPQHRPVQNWGRFSFGRNVAKEKTETGGGTSHGGKRGEARGC